MLSEKGEEDLQGDPSQLSRLARGLTERLLSLELTTRNEFLALVDSTFGALAFLVGFGLVSSCERDCG